MNAVILRCAGLAGGAGCSRAGHLDVVVSARGQPGCALIHVMAIDAEGFLRTGDRGFLEELLARMGSTEAGLTSAEALDRLARFGPNAVEEKRIPPLFQFLKRYWGPMPWLLEVAIALSVLSGHVLEAVIIFFLLTVNAVIGFLESRNSQRAVSMMTRRAWRSCPRS